jgi:hypothetical protein
LEDAKLDLGSDSLVSNIIGFKNSYPLDESGDKTFRIATFRCCIGKTLVGGVEGRSAKILVRGLLTVADSEAKTLSSHNEAVAAHRLHKMASKSQE